VIRLIGKIPAIKVFNPVNFGNDENYGSSDTTH